MVLCSRKGDNDGNGKDGLSGKGDGKGNGKGDGNGKDGLSGKGNDNG
jgi:hypothetical protein